MSEYIIILFKEVGKEPVLQKIKNGIEHFEELLGGEIEKLKYDEITILFRKENKYLRPNIYISGNFEKIGLSIRGDLIIVCEENNTYKSLNKEQAVKFGKFLVDESFDYRYFDENGKYIGSKRKKKKRYTNNIPKQEKVILEKDDFESSSNVKKEDENYFNAEEVLNMILNLQKVILEFIKNVTE